MDIGKGSRWRFALREFLDDIDNDDDEDGLAEEFLGALTRACKAQHDALEFRLSSKQAKHCYHVFDRFPQWAKKLFGGELGKPYGPYSKSPLMRP